MGEGGFVQNHAEINLFYFVCHLLSDRRTCVKYVAVAHKYRNFFKCQCLERGENENL